MSNINQAPLQARHYPLAVDETGKPIPIPPEAAFWRVRRHTAGRPRVIVGADRQPLKLPLDYTADELLYLVGRGAYRLDLCDETGEQLETVAITIGEPEPELRNSAPSVEEVSPMLPSTGNEVRLVLEANVRATQLAFQHNERTLSASLKMAETLRDGVQVLATSQAEWIKAIASSRGLFRNAAPPFVQAPPSDADGEDDDDDDEVVYDNSGQIYALGTEVMKFVNGMVGNGTSVKPGAKLKQLANKSGIDLALLDWRRAAAHTDEQAHASEQADATDQQLAAPMSLIQVMQIVSSLPDEVRAKIEEVRAQLSASEQKQLMIVFAATTPEQLVEIANELAAKPVEETLALIRARLAPAGKE